MHGGSRPGAGRPRKGEQPAEAEAIAQAKDQTPLEYMLDVMNDPNASDARRDRMAQAAAPYMHAKAGEPVGKKAERDERARTAENGTEWEEALSGPSASH